MTLHLTENLICVQPLSFHYHLIIYSTAKSKHKKQLSVSKVWSLPAQQRRKPDDSGNAVMFFMCCAGWSQHWLLYLLFMKEAGWRGLLMMHIFLSAPSLPLSLFICSTTKQIICFSCTEYCNYVCIMSTTPSANWHYCFFWIIFEIIYKETFSLAPPLSLPLLPSVESSICRSAISALRLFSLVDFWNMQMLPRKIAKKKREKPSSGLQEISIHGTRCFPLVRARVLVLFALSVKGLSN